MALVTSRTSLSQGASTSISDAAFVTAVGAGDIRVTSAATEIPTIAVGEFIEFRDHSLTSNNGLYQVAVFTSTGDFEVDKVSGSAPANSAAEAVTTRGSTADQKSVMFDVAGLGVYILEKGNVDSAGVEGQAIYSFAMQEWKNDDFLISNAPFPMLAIDSDAGKYIIGQDISGNNNGWNWVDSASFGVIRTRKLLRNMGWDEVDANGNTIAREVCIVTLGVFEDETNDNAYFFFGSDTTTDNSVGFDFNGSVNESVRFFEEQTQTDLVITTTTITRVGGSFITEGYKVGGQVTIRNAEDAGNDSTFVLTAVTATELTSTGLTANADDTAAILAVDNDNAITINLRVRDGDTNGKTYAAANLASAGKTILGNFVYAFPLGNSTDLKISATDLEIDANTNGIPDISPYGDDSYPPTSGMSITYENPTVSRTDLVTTGNYSITVDANGGTAEEAFEFIQFMLRQTVDIDAGATTSVGKMMDGMARFVGDTGEFGSTDGAATGTPYNPSTDAVGGVYVTNLAASSKNSVTFFDDTGVGRKFPETIAVTLDFNQIAIDDTTTEYDLFYDRTIRTTPTDLVLTTSTDLLTSAGATLPTNSEIAVGSYVRLENMTLATMDGTYQIVALGTPNASWTVTRYDGVTIETSTTSATATIDQNCIDTPDAILVHTNITVDESTGSTALAFVAPDQITDTDSGLGAFTVGQFIEVENSTANSGIYEIATVAVGQLDLVEQTITAEAVGVDTTVVLTEVVSGLAAADLEFSYDFDGNVQGGRTISTTTAVKAKAVGSTGAQYVESSVSSIVTGTPLTIPLAAATERNYA